MRRTEECIRGLDSKYKLSRKQNADFKNQKKRGIPFFGRPVDGLPKTVAG